MNSPNTSQNSWWRQHQRQLAPWLFLAPVMLLFTLYVIAPIFQSIAISFYDWDGLGEAKFIGFGNYVELWDDTNFWLSLKNNLIWFFGFLLSVPAGLFLALFLNQKVFGIRLVKSLFFFPFVISQVVVGLIFTWFYNPSLGFVGDVMQFFGIKPFAILADEDYVTYGIVVAGIYPQMAYTMILYLTGLNNLRPDLIEAARLEGAKGWTMLWHVILPQLRPATFIAVVVTIIGSLRSFDMISIMTSGGPYGQSRVLAYYMYEQALSEYGYRMGYGTAIATVLFLITLVYILFFIYRIYKQEKDSA
jgi:multiple sugar transport system permease protein